MPLDEKRAFVEKIEKRHGHSLRRFLSSRLRNAISELPDVAQEVFLRLLRIEQHETIRNPEAYLITVASHVLHQRTLRLATQPNAIDSLDALETFESPPELSPAHVAEIQQQVEELERTMRGLSPKARAALVLHRRDGYTVEEVGARLGISRDMAKKYLAQALAHCRKRMTGLE